MVNLEDRFKRVRTRVFSDMIKRDSKKYKSFLKKLRYCQVVLGNKNRAHFYQAYYLAMRIIDDVVDQDIALPHSFDSSEAYVSSKIDFAKTLSNPSDDPDYLFLYAFERAAKFGAEFKQETDDILRSMLFDAQRYGTHEIYSEAVLGKHFYELDTTGTVQASLKTFGEDPRKYAQLTPLSEATRIYYDLRDYDDDLKKGFVNITQEDCHAFGITSTDFTSENEKVIAWKRSRAERGLELLEEHRNIMRQTHLNMRVRYVLPKIYVKPAKKYFLTVLRE